MSVKSVEKHSNQRAFIAPCFFAARILTALIFLGIFCISPSPLRASSVDNIQVLGTVTGPDKNSNYAIIIVDKGDAINFKKGQTVLPGYVLDKIYDDKITLKHGAQSLDIKIGVPFSSEDFNVESGVPPTYEQAPLAEPAPAPEPPMEAPSEPPPDATPPSLPDGSESESP